MAEFDIAVIGGGINGAGIARDAAGRGLRVLLVEQNDLGSGTSSASSKLVHGGLRYLEHWAFGLVRESLAEREVLMHVAPHLVHPARFVLPVDPHGRSAWMLRLGLYLYDWLGRGGSLPPAAEIDLNVNPAGTPLRRAFFSGFEYSDCLVDDARLVVLTALDAAERGAVVSTRTRCTRAERSDEWSLVLNRRGERWVTTARVLVNATGPWLPQFCELVLRQKKRAPVRLVKGSHIVVPRLAGHDRPYIFQNPDRRVVFAIPFQNDFTLIGTTDVDFVGDLAALAPSREEIAYLCDAANLYFREIVSTADVVWAFAGVRALYDSGRRRAQEASRDYKAVLDQRFGRAPLLNLYGGKLTTYRRVAEEVMDKLAIFFAPRPAWTADAVLPGGDLGGGTLAQFVERLRHERAFLPQDLAARLAGAYGSRAERILQDARSLDDLGQDFGHGLSAAEVRYLMKHEWAETVDDVLWRRTKLGLKLSSRQKDALARFMADEAHDPARLG